VRIEATVESTHTKRSFHVYKFIYWAIEAARCARAFSSGGMHTRLNICSCVPLPLSRMRSRDVRLFNRALTGARVRG
jgi:hypothetical protein